MRHCTTSWKVVGWNFSQAFRPHYGTGFDTATNRNEYQEYLLGLKVDGA
jgi:hypothetical protein